MKITDLINHEKIRILVAIEMFQTTPATIFGLNSVHFAPEYKNTAFAAKKAKVTSTLATACDRYIKYDGCH